MLRHRPASGLTLIELLIGIALLAVLLGLAAPSFQAQIAASQLTSATHALLGSLMQARAQAIRLGKRVTVCRTHDQQQCDNNAARGWESGWLVFVDIDRAGNTDAFVSPTDTVLTRNEALPPALRVRGNAQVDNFISFGATGEARTMAGGNNPLGTIRVCSQSSALADADRERNLVLAAGGRIADRPSPAAVGANCL
jgi:type IV fimbrial biogenesis protein FimT